MRVHGLLFLLAGALLAGCLGTPLVSPEPPIVDGKVSVRAAFDALPLPTYDPVAGVSEWESFVTTYPKRDMLLPHNAGAEMYLAAELKKAGYDAAIEDYPFTRSGQATPVTTQVVRGVLLGADPARRFALVSHYDGQTATTQAAYDDGAGTIAQLQICRELAKQKALLTHTIECLFFDGEEMGLVASSEFIKAYTAQADRGFEYELAFGYDMTGINWPGHAWKLYAMIGTDTEKLGELTEGFGGFLKVGLHEFLPTAKGLEGATQGIEILQVHDRNSDEQNFKRAGIPVVRFAGGRKAADYPCYHQPCDTTLYVYQFVGGRANFEKGYDAVVRSSYYTILAFDGFDPKALPTA